MIKLQKTTIQMLLLLVQLGVCFMDDFGIVIIEHTKILILKVC